MSYEPIVLLRNLGPEEVKQLIESNFCSSKTEDQSKNVQKYPKCRQGNGTEQVEKIVISNNSPPTAENQQQSSCSSSTIQNLSTNLNDNNLDKIKLLKKPKIDNYKYQGVHAELFKREAIVVLDNSYDKKIRDKMEMAAQHPKTGNSNVKKHMTNESTSIMTMKSVPVVEVIDKHTKEVSSASQMTAEKPDRQTNDETVVHDSSGLRLRSRTISTVSAASCRVVPRPRRRSLNPITKM